VSANMDPREVAAPIVECGEDLVRMESVASLRVAARSGPATLLRVTVIDRLVTAQSLLPRGLRLLILEGYRQLAAEPGAAQCAGLHATGGAVDLTLCTESGAAVPIDGPGTGEPPNRLILDRALTAAGLVNLPAARWHWCYGDVYWCYRTGAATARYGPIRS
jgi:D-alanyl-D-alanine dipeptidase